MNGWVLGSFITLWVVVLVQLIFSATIFRQLGIVIMGTARGAAMSGIPIGKQLPDEVLATLGGNHWSRASWIGRPYLLFFGAPYCSECKEIWPSLMDTARSLKLNVVAFLFAEEAEAQEYATQNGLSFPIVPIGQDVGRLYDVDVIPFAYAVDEEGVVRSKGLANSTEVVRALGLAVSKSELKLVQSAAI